MYKEKQKEWIKSYDLKMGDRVEIVEKHITEDWGDLWSTSMDKLVGKVGIVVNINPVYGLAVLVSGMYFNYPYTSLKPVDKVQRGEWFLLD